MTLRLMWFVPPAINSVADALGLLPRDAIVATRTNSSDEQFEALTSNSCDAVVTAMDNVFVWNRRSTVNDFRVIAQIERTTPLALVARSSFKTLSELRGKNLLVDSQENGFVIALRAILANAGIEASAYNLKQVGGVKERFDALLAEAGDATLLGPPFDAMALSKGQVLLAKVQDFFPDFPGQGVVVRQSQLGRLRSDLKAWLNALETARRDVDVQSGGVSFTRLGFDDPTIDIILKTWPGSLLPDRKGVELLINQRQQLGLAGADDSIGTLVDESFLLH